METERARWARRVLELQLKVEHLTGGPIKPPTAEDARAQQAAREELARLLSAVPPLTWRDTLPKYVGGTLSLSLIAGLLFWAYSHTASREPLGRFEFEVAGSWRSILTARELHLDLTHEAWISDGPGTKKTVIGRGKWRAEGDVAIIDIPGEDVFKQRKLVLIRGGEDQVFLVPDPPDAALLKDCWIAEIQDEEPDR